MEECRLQLEFGAWQPGHQKELDGEEFSKPKDNAQCNKISMNFGVCRAQSHGPLSSVPFSPPSSTPPTPAPHSDRREILLWNS